MLEDVPADDDIEGGGRQRVVLEIPDDPLVQAWVALELLLGYVDSSQVNVLAEIKVATPPTTSVEDAQAGAR
jgi:hypothetical protein